MRSAFAQDQDAAAARLLSQAITAFTDGAFAAARKQLARARQLARKPALLSRISLQLGLNYAAENREEEARASFRDALSHDPQVDLDEQHYKPSFVELFRSVRRSLDGQLEVSADRGDILVWVGGRAAGKAPLRQRLPPGDHVVEIRGPRGESLHRSSVRIVPGQTSRLAVAGLTPSRNLTSDRSGPHVPLHDGPGTAPAARRPRRLWTWVVGAAAVASAGVALGLGLSANADRGSACDLLGDSARACEDRTRVARAGDLARYRELYDAAHRKALIANVTWGLAAATAVGTAILYWLEARGPSARPGRVSIASRALGLAVGIAY
ncbi:MAG: hypothetical protein IT371_28020 [Deltaproteobacteria bacterium]|nr:hypothetical protein [Deltaproteobacteria bacterium]